MSEATCFQLEVDRNVVIVTFLPALNQLPWADIEHVGQQVVSRVQTLSSPRLVVDLTPLEYMGSAQVALIVRMFKSVKEKGGEMVVACHHPVVEEVLALAGLTKIWNIVRSKSEALGSSGQTSAEQRSESLVPVYLGMATGMLALVLLAAVLGRVSVIPLGVGMWLGLICATATFGGGLMGVLRSPPARSGLGVAVLMGGLALMMASVYVLASPPRTEKVATKSRGDSDDSDSENKDEEAPKSAAKDQPTKSDAEILADPAVQTSLKTTDGKAAATSAKPE